MAIPDFTGILSVVLGIGFLIFVHELGHFLVAKMVGIRVLEFSIGFGPRIIGFRRGETDYRLSLLPIGGYVKMAGETPEDQTVIDERDFRSKTVGQRAAVLSAGVVMNAIFAFLLFSLAFGLGVPFRQPVVGAVEPGSEAWRQRLPIGARVLTVNGNKIYDFADIATEIAISKGSAVLEYRDLDGNLLTKKVTAVRSPRTGFYAIGIGPTSSEMAVEEGSNAHAAGLRTGDVIVAVNGREIGPRYSVQQAFAQITSPTGDDETEIRLRVRRDGVVLDIAYNAEWQPDPRYRIGVGQVSNEVVAIRDNVDLAAYDLRVGDVIRSIAGSDVGSALQIDQALESVPIGEPFNVVLEREGKLEARTWRFADASARVELQDAIALGDKRESEQILVSPGTPAAAAGLRTHDEIVKVGEEPVATYQELYTALGKHQSEEPVAIEYLRGGEVFQTTITPRPSYNIARKIRMYEDVRSSSLTGAFSDGFARTIYYVKHIFVILDRMLVHGSVSTKNMGGIVMISKVSYEFAKTGIGKLVYFLAILSVNLAILNLLPIPVLDGGQLLFLLVEKIKGSPVSDRVQQYAAFMGVAAVLFLVLYVTYNDIERLILYR